MSATLRRIKSRLRRVFRPPLHRPDVVLPFRFLGTEYGGWPLLESTPRGAVVYSFGIGEDISFDLQAIERFGCIVYGFDPTPKSRAWIARQSLPSAFKFYPIGVAAVDGEAEFAPPAQKAHVSFSSTRSMRNPIPDSIKAPVKRLKTLISQFDIAQPDIIKLDIEGFEYEVIPDMLSNNIYPNQLLVEFHHGLYGFRKYDTRYIVDKIKFYGYNLFYISSSGREYGFCNSHSA